MKLIEIQLIDNFYNQSIELSTPLYWRLILNSNIWPNIWYLKFKKFNSF